MTDIYSSWLLFFEYIVCLPLSFIVCGPLFYSTKGRKSLILWFSIIQILIILVLYVTTTPFRFWVVLLFCLWITVSFLGIAAAHFGWKLGVRVKKVLESVAGVWLKFLDLFLNT